MPPPVYPMQGQVPQAGYPMAQGAGFMAQFSGDALWSVGLGLVSIVVPFFLGRVFYFLPLIGIYYGIRAITRGKVIGGSVGIALSVIGGIISAIALFAR
jgi:hypothetical protein